MKRALHTSHFDSTEHAERQLEQRIYTAIVNYDFEEMEALLKKIDKNKKKFEFLIKVAKIKHSFKTYIFLFVLLKQNAITRL